MISDSELLNRITNLEWQVRELNIELAKRTEIKYIEAVITSRIAAGYLADCKKWIEDKKN